MIVPGRAVYAAGLGDHPGWVLRMKNPDLPTTVAFAACADYAPAAVEAAVRAAVHAAGGIHRWVQPGQSVLLKPNLLTDAAPDAAVTTHPAIVRAATRLVKEAGGECRVGDSPASVIKHERVWTHTGMRAVCEEEGVPLVTLEQGGARRFTRDGQAFEIAQSVLDADVVINLPKVKTHVLTGLTCAVKNVYGCVPGLAKSGLHKRYFNARDFGRVVASIYGAVQPTLTIADGIVGMTGNGPSSGEPTPLGFIAASRDGVALDCCICRLLGIKPRAVPYLPVLKRRGVGEHEPGRMRIVGTDLAALRRDSVALPNTLGARLVPSWLARIFAPLLWCRPAFRDDCVYCGLCVRTCPAGALSQAAGAKPVLDPRLCIECCCCHEVCPAQAIDMQLSPLFQRFVKQDKCLSTDNYAPAQ